MGTIKSKTALTSLYRQKAHLNFLILGNNVCFHSMFWRVLAGSYWCTHISLPVTIQCRKAPLSSWYHCKNCMHVSMHACLYSCVRCFGTRLAQILWYPRSLWTMEYADPQLMSKLLAISATVIHLSSWTRVKTCSTLFVIREVVKRPEWSPMTLVLPLWNLFTHWYTFLYIIQFSLNCANICLWILESFTHYDHRNGMTARRSRMVQYEKRADVLTLLI
jgi:hypothetical protein